MKLSPVNKYIMHCSGLYAMLAWLEEQEENGTACKIANETIFLPPLSARYFSLGTSKYKSAKLPFLCVQPNESKWFKLVQWESITIREKDSNLYLISELIKGDGVTYPDIPQFAVAIPFDKIEKLDLLKNFKNIDMREYFIDTDSAIRVNFHNKICSIQLLHIAYNQPYLQMTNNIINYKNLMQDKETTLQSVFGNEEPAFKGELADIPGVKGVFNNLFGFGRDKK